MVKLIDEFRQGWQGISRTSSLFNIGFAASCIVLATAARWCLSLLRPDVFFAPYFPAVFFATAFGGYRIGIATAIAGRHARPDPEFWRLPRSILRRLVLSGNLCDRVRPHDLGRRALSIDRHEAAGNLETTDPGRRLSQARRRRASTPAEKQIVDRSRRTSPGAARSTANLGPNRPTDAGAVRDRRSDRRVGRQRLRYQGSLALRTRSLTAMSDSP